LFSLSSPVPFKGRALISKPHSAKKNYPLPSPIQERVRERWREVWREVFHIP
jgi:hypothetical protein